MYSSTQTNYILPELKIIRIGDLISLKQTKFGQPQLIFANQTYKQLCQSQDSEVVHYVKTKKAQYENLKTALNRRSSTVRLIAESIIRTQYKYILKKTDILRPLLLRQVATQLHVSESTVSRAIHGVYIETERGVVPLKGFFTRYATRNRTSGQSVSEIEQAIQTIIAEENQTQPLSDEKIKQRLNQQGFPISRRAVTKHRSNLGILSTRERKE
jgi:RNA polymerase sigma-54 factor